MDDFIRKFFGFSGRPADFRGPPHMGDDDASGHRDNFTGSFHGDFHVLDEVMREMDKAFGSMNFGGFQTTDEDTDNIDSGSRGVFNIPIGRQNTSPRDSMLKDSDDDSRRQDVSVVPSGHDHPLQGNGEIRFRRPPDIGAPLDNDNVSDHRDHFSGNVPHGFHIMEEVMREMDKIFGSMNFGGFQAIDEDSENSGSRGFHNIPFGRQNNSPRDSMLKDPDEESRAQDVPMVPSGQNHPFGGRGEIPSFPTPLKTGPRISIFSSLPRRDDCNEGEDVGSELTPMNSSPTPGFFSWGFSSSTVTNSDGMTEKRVTQRDNSGKEVTTVTRIQGDQRHTVTTTRDPVTGQVSTETTTNDLPGNVAGIEYNFLHKPKINEAPLDHNKNSIFQRFFGKFIKGD